MSQLEFDDLPDQELEVQAPTGNPLLTSLLVSAGVFLAAASVIVAIHMGSTYAIGPFRGEPARGAIQEISPDREYIKFTAAPAQDVTVGDVVYIISNDNSEVVGRAEVVYTRHGGAAQDTLNVMVDEWGFDPGSDFVGRILPDYTRVDTRDPSKFDVARDYDIVNRRPRDR